MGNNIFEGYPFLEDTVFFLLDFFEDTMFDVF